MRKYLITSLVTLIALILIIPSCRSTNNESKEIREIVDSFAICYFNWQYEKATKYCTNPQRSGWNLLQVKLIIKTLKFSKINKTSQR